MYLPQIALTIRWRAEPIHGHRDNSGLAVRLRRDARSRRTQSSREDAAARKSGLCTDNVVFSHDARVTHLHETIDLRPALNARFAHRRAINRRERLNLHVVLDHRDSGLHDLEMLSVRLFCEPEAVTPD